jgi:hypothetical protein
MQHTVWTFLRLVWSEWASRVTGSLSAVLVLLGLGISLAGTFGAQIPAASIIQLATWLLAAACGGQAAYAVWGKEREARNAAEAKLVAHACGVSFEFEPSLDRSNNVNTLEMRTKIINVADRALSYTWKVISTKIGDKQSLDGDTGPFILRRGTQATWFPGRGLTREEYDALQRETVGSLHYEVLYGVAGEPHDRKAEGDIGITIIKHPETGDITLHWRIEREADDAILQN